MPFTIKTSREAEEVETNKAEVLIGSRKFTLEMDHKGRLVITKYDYSDGSTDDTITINPGIPNQIKIF